MKHVLPLPVLQFPVLGVRDCVKCKLAPHGFAATYLTVLQQCSCSSLQRSQRWRLLIHMLLRKITKYNIHLRFTVCPVRHCIHAHSRGAEANFSSALSAHNSWTIAMCITFVHSWLAFCHAANKRRLIDWLIDWLIALLRSQEGVTWHIAAANSWIVPSCGLSILNKRILLLSKLPGFPLWMRAFKHLNDNESFKRLRN